MDPDQSHLDIRMKAIKHKIMVLSGKGGLLFSLCFISYFKLPILCAGMAKWLGRSTLVLRVKGSSYGPDLLQKVRGEYLQPSVIPGKKAKGITRCGHIERKDQGHTA